MNKRLFKKILDQLDTEIQENWDDAPMKQMTEGLRNDKNPTFVWEWKSPDTQEGWKLELNYDLYNYEDQLKTNERTLNLFFSWEKSGEDSYLPNMTRTIYSHVLEDDPSIILLNMNVKIDQVPIARFYRRISRDIDLGRAYYASTFRA